MTNTQPDIVKQLHLSAQSLSAERLPAGWEIVGSSGYARVAVNAGQGIFYKEFLPRGPMESLKARLRGSRACRARRNSDALNFAGFEAPENIAWGTSPNGREYLFTRAARGLAVSDWLQAVLAERNVDNRAVRRLLLRELGRFVGRLHHTGFIHGDLRTGNVLAERNGERFRFALIDNERNSRHDTAPGKLLLKNLMQLNMHTHAELSQSDRWRFFQAWHRQMRELSDTEAQLLAAQAYRWAMRRLQAKGKLGLAPGSGAP